MQESQLKPNIDNQSSRPIDKSNNINNKKQNLNETNLNSHYKTTDKDLNNHYSNTESYNSIFKNSFKKYSKNNSPVFNDTFDNVLDLDQNIPNCNPIKIRPNRLRSNEIKKEPNSPQLNDKFSSFQSYSEFDRPSFSDSNYLDFDSLWTVYNFSHLHPGLFVIRGAINTKQQILLARDCLTNFLEKNKVSWSNETQSTEIESNSLDKSDNRDKCNKYSSTSARNQSGYWTNNDSMISSIYENSHRENKQILLNKENILILKKYLRWIHMGYLFDYNTHTYDYSECRPMDADLYTLAVTIAENLNIDHKQLTNSSIHDSGKTNPISDCISSNCIKNPNPTFEPDMVLLNYYCTTGVRGLKSTTLCPHTDTYEQTMQFPIVTVSLGQSAIFQIGSNSLSTEPTSILLRNGDICVMSGQCRTAYHAVPKVFRDHSDPFLDLFKQSKFNSQLNITNSDKIAEQPNRTASLSITTDNTNIIEISPYINTVETNKSNLDNTTDNKLLFNADLPTNNNDEIIDFIVDYLSDFRINLSIRQAVDSYE